MFRLLSLIDLPLDVPTGPALPLVVMGTCFVMWVLSSDERTTRLERLVKAARRRAR